MDEHFSTRIEESGALKSAPPSHESPSTSISTSTATTNNGPRQNGIITPPSSPPRIPHISTAPKQAITNKLCCRERKRIFVDLYRPSKLTKDMQQWFHKTNWLLDPFLEEDECWFHPSPPPPRINSGGHLRPYGKINRRFQWQDKHGQHSLVVNYGVICKLLYHDMTKQQKDGYINRQWHVSHLCGNWSCINSAHTVIEPGSVNLSRNDCFSHRSGCFHDPPCMKDKKVALGADGKPIDHNAPAPTFVIEDGWNPLISHDVDDEVDYLMDDNMDSGAISS